MNFRIRNQYSKSVYTITDCSWLTINIDDNREIPKSKIDKKIEMKRISGTTSILFAISTTSIVLMLYLRLSLFLFCTVCHKQAASGK